MIERRNDWLKFEGAEWCSIETRDKIVKELGLMIAKEFCIYTRVKQPSAVYLPVN